jgi:hypothetical protein
MSAGFPLRISHETGRLVHYVLDDQGNFVHTKEKRKAEKPAELGSFYSVQEVAVVLGISEQSVRNHFQDRPGVVKITKGKRSRGKREYVGLRIPRAVFDAYVRGDRG